MISITNTSFLLNCGRTNVSSLFKNSRSQLQFKLVSALNLCSSISLGDLQRDVYPGPPDKVTGWNFVNENDFSMCAGPTNCTTKTTKQNLLPLFCEMLVTSNMHGFVLLTFILKTFTIRYWARKGMLPEAHNSQYYGTTLERRKKLLLQGWPARRQEARFTCVFSVQDLWGFNTRSSQTIDP